MGPLSGLQGQHTDQASQCGRPDRVVGVSAYLDGTDLVEEDVITRQNERKGEQGGAPISVVEGVEEKHVEVSTGSPGVERDVRAGDGGLRQALLEPDGRFRAQAIAFAPLFGKGRELTKEDVPAAQDEPLPFGDKIEVKRRVGCRVCAGQSPRRAHAVPAPGVIRCVAGGRNRVDPIAAPTDRADKPLGSPIPLDL
jgi:hypothetical protein